MAGNKNRVPDFAASWHLEERESFFHVPGQDGIDQRDIAPKDNKDPLWCGYASKYVDHSGNADGWEFDIFGRGAVFRMWGLIEEDHYNGYGLFCGSYWQFFNGKDYQAIIVRELKEKKGFAAVVLAITIQIRVRDTEHMVLSLRIPKDPIGLPPVNK